MKQPTKKQLKDKIELLQHDLYKAISKLPNGDVKDELVKKYPFWYTYLFAEKYGKSYGDNLLNLLNENPIIKNDSFYWFEERKTI